MQNTTNGLFVTARDARIGADNMIQAQGIRIRPKFKGMLARELDARRTREAARGETDLPDTIRVKVIDRASCIVGHISFHMDDLAAHIND